MDRMAGGKSRHGLVLKRFLEDRDVHFAEVLDFRLRHAFGNELLLHLRYFPGRHVLDQIVELLLLRLRVLSLVQLFNDVLERLDPNFLFIRPALAVGYRDRLPGLFSDLGG